MPNQSRIKSPRELIEENRSKFYVKEVKDVGTDDDEIVVVAVSGYSSKLERYMNILSEELDVRISLCSGTNRIDTVIHKYPWDGEEIKLENPPLDQFIEGFKKQYPIHYYGEFGADLEVDQVRHTDKIWLEDAIAVYKYFDRDPKTKLRLTPTDKIFIGLEVYQGHSRLGIPTKYINFYFCYKYADWYLVNQFEDKDLFNYLKGLIMKTNELTFEES